MITRFYAAWKVTRWYCAIIGEWREWSPLSSSAVDVGSYIELSILGEGRGAPGGRGWRQRSRHSESSRIAGRAGKPRSSSGGN